MLAISLGEKRTCGMSGCWPDSSGEFGFEPLCRIGLQDDCQIGRLWARTLGPWYHRMTPPAVPLKQPSAVACLVCKSRSSATEHNNNYRSRRIRSSSWLYATK